MKSTCTLVWGHCGIPDGELDGRREPGQLRSQTGLHHCCLRCCRLGQSFQCFHRYQILHRKAEHSHKPRRRLCCIPEINVTPTIRTRFGGFFTCSLTVSQTFSLTVSCTVRHCCSLTVSQTCRHHRVGVKLILEKEC